MKFMGHPHIKPEIFEKIDEMLLAKKSPQVISNVLGVSKSTINRRKDQLNIKRNKEYIFRAEALTFTDEEKNQLLELMSNPEVTVNEICRKFLIGTGIYYKYRRIFVEEGHNIPVKPSSRITAESRKYAEELLIHNYSLGYTCVLTGVSESTLYKMRLNLIKNNQFLSPLEPVDDPNRGDNTININARIYYVREPDGTVVKLRNLSKYCREKNLIYARLYNRLTYPEKYNGICTSSVYNGYSKAYEHDYIKQQKLNCKVTLQEVLNG